MSIDRLHKVSGKYLCSLPIDKSLEKCYNGRLCGKTGAHDRGRADEKKADPTRVSSQWGHRGDSPVRTGVPAALLWSGQRNPARCACRTALRGDRASKSVHLHLFRNDHAAQFINPSYNTSCFHVDYLFPSFDVFIIPQVRGVVNPFSQIFALNHEILCIITL